MLRPEQLAAFARDGLLLVPALFDAEEIDLLTIACAKDQALARQALDMRDGAGGIFVQTVWNHPGDDVYGMFARCRRLVGAMEQVLGGEVYHYHSKITWKRPGDGALAWHQDYGYWYENGCLFPDLASCLIAIDKAERDNACLQVLRGSHRIGRLEHRRIGDVLTVDPERLAEAMKRLELVHCEMAPGDALFIHCNIVHRSEANVSDCSRRTLICCYNAASNDPYKDSEHPRYTPLESVPDEAIKAAGRRLSEPDKVFLTTG
ncbi:MAG: phytanoyl-CoA dioxygenase family protein [Armatimonadetes bacterium]|nr:phytanoyl-CoA dioxygenase family protein [Armatimonadota bacterium]